MTSLTPISGYKPNTNPLTGVPYASPASSGSSVGAGYAGNPKSKTGTDFLESIIPGYSKLAGQTTDIIGNLLNGTPSPSTTRQAAATFGNSNGLGTGSGIVNRYGYDLYNQKGQQNQQTGIANLLNMIQGVSSPVLSNQGQQNQNSQFYSNLGQQGNQFDKTFGLQEFLAQLQALGLGNSITNDNYQLPTINF